MQFLSAARVPNASQSCREMTSLISEYKHMEGNFPAQYVQRTSKGFPDRSLSIQAMV